MMVEQDLRIGLADAELLRATSSDPECFGMFYDRHVDGLLSYFQRRTGDFHTATDLTAETFAQALRSCHRYKESLGSGRAWLYGIAQHQLNHYFRSHEVSRRYMRRLDLTNRADDAQLERVETLIDAAPQLAALGSALKTLPQTLAEAIVLRVGQELSFDEVAQRLGCTPGAARVRVSRGLVRLAQAVHS